MLSNLESCHPNRYLAQLTTSEAALYAAQSVAMRCLAEFKNSSLGFKLYRKFLKRSAAKVEQDNSHDFYTFAAKHLGPDNAIQRYRAEYQDCVVREYEERRRVIEAEVPLWGVFSNREELYTLIRLARPRRVVETGLGSGASTWVILKALQKNSAETSDHHPTLATISKMLPQFINIDGVFVYADPDWRSKWPNWQLIVGDSLAQLPDYLNNTGEIQYFLHDSRHIYDYMIREYGWAERYLTPGGIISSDDANYRLPISRPLQDFSIKMKFPYHIHKGLGVAVKTSAAI
jgi:hypothetical protein